MKVETKLGYSGMTGLVATAILNAIYAKRYGNCEIGGKAKWNLNL